MSDRQSDVLVLGGGVIGLVSALELLRAGRSVTVLEKATLGSGASHGNCGTITPSHAPPLAMPGMVTRAIGWMFTPDAPFYVKPSLDPGLWSWLLQVARRCNWDEFKRHTRVKGELLMRSRELLVETIARERLDCEFEQRGTLYVFRSMQDFEGHALAARGAERGRHPVRADRRQGGAAARAGAERHDRGRAVQPEGRRAPSEPLRGRAGASRARARREPGRGRDGDRLRARGRRGFRRGDRPGSVPRQGNRARARLVVAPLEQAVGLPAPDPARQGLLDHVRAPGAVAAHPAGAEGAQRVRHGLEQRLPASAAPWSSRATTRA
jgi:D-amino-acid dehydrogenase